MTRLNATFTCMIIILLIAGCSTGVDPVTVGETDCSFSSAHVQDTGADAGPAILWGVYDFYIDVVSGTAEVVPMRGSTFAANVVTFLNGNPAGVGVSDLEVIPGTGYTDINLNVSLAHPLASEAYKGYDVRGIFIGNGSIELDYDGDLIAARQGNDQILLNADGYTRWWNPAEFGFPGVLGYTPGKIASGSYTGNATLNPYKYFADDLDPNDDVWDFLADPGYSDSGVFSHSTVNTRYYRIRFPDPPAGTGVRFGYAVVANWQGEDPVEDHPSNAGEAVAVSTLITPDVYYQDETNNGGSLILDINVYDWHSTVTAGVMEDYAIIIESEVLSDPYTLNTGEMTPVGGSGNYSTYHTEIPADNVTFNTPENDYSEYWVIVESQNHDYTCEFTPDDPHAAPDAPLAAFFRYDLFISDEPYNLPPVADLEITTPETFPVYSWDTGLNVTFDASGSTDPNSSQTLTYEWDFNNDGLFNDTGDDYDFGTDEIPVKNYSTNPDGDVVTVRVTDPFGESDTASVVLGAVNICPSKDIFLSSGTYYCRDVAVDPTTGDALVAYYRFQPTSTRGIYVRRYDYDTCYSTYTTIDVNVVPDYDPYVKIDCGYDGNWFVSNVPYTANDVIHWFHYDSTDTLINTYTHPFNETLHGVADVIAMGPNGNQANDHFIAYFDTFMMAGTLENYLRGTTDTAFTPPTIYTQNDGTVFDILQLPDDLRFMNLSSCEADLTGDYVWLCHANAYYCSRWAVDISGNQLSYTDRYFGDGSQSEGITGYVEPLDMTIGEDGHCYILDNTSSGYKIKGFESDGSTGDGTTPLGMIDITSPANTPHRIDACDSINGDPYSAILLLLQRNSPDTYNSSLSVYTISETP